jgi:hypothetical protein
MKLSIAATVLLLLFSTGMSLSAIAQQQLRMGELKFMSGKWKGSMEWGDMEEHWSEPAGNGMMCSYRCVKDGKIVFYEFIVIEQLENDTMPVMKLRHFNPGNIAWEDKASPFSYPLVKLEPNKARFEKTDKKTAMTFQRTAKNKLKVTLEREDGDGKWKVDVFNYTLAEK